MASDGTGVGPETVPARRLDSRTRNMRDKVLVGGANQALELTGPATLIWKSIDGARSVRQIAEIVCGEYDVDLDTATADAAEVVAQLADADVVTLSPPPEIDTT